MSCEQRQKFHNGVSCMHAGRGPILSLINSNDVVYNGLLVEVTETTVELQGEGQWITISVDSISSITPIASP